MLSNLWGREPVALMTLLRAAIIFGTAFGLKLTAEQIAGTYMLVEAVLMFVTRGQVSPVPKPPAPPSRGVVTPVSAFVLTFALLAGLGAAPLVGCASVPGGAAKDPDSLVRGSTALAFNGGVVALEFLDQREVEYLDSIVRPTTAEINAATSRVERLKRARDALAIAREWLAGNASKEAGSAALRDGLKLLQTIADELKANGVTVPQPVLQGLSAASTFVGEP